MNAPRVAAHREEVRYSDGRLAGHGLVVECPFCLLAHHHGSTLGRRNSHCDMAAGPRKRKVDPRDTQGNPGYVLCDPADDIEWAAEQLYGQLFVLRNKYRRLRSEHAQMIPLGAREERVKRNLKAELDELANILTKAGVKL